MRRPLLLPPAPCSQACGAPPEPPRLKTGTTPPPAAGAGAAEDEDREEDEEEVDGTASVTTCGSRASTSCRGK